MPNLVRLNGVAYPVAADDLLPRGKRALERESRPVQDSDARTQERHWQLWGPMGTSEEEAATRFLGVDYCTNLDHGNTPLLTSQTARTTLDTSTLDPTETTGRFLPLVLPFTLGAFDVSNMDTIESNFGFVLLGRGQALTTVTASSMAVLNTQAKPAAITDMTNWQAGTAVAYGAINPVEQIVSVDTSVGPRFGDIAEVFANKMAVGTDRWWGAQIDPETGETTARHSLDNLETFSDPFPFADSKVPSTGIGTMGQYTVIGHQEGAGSFDNSGNPVRVLEGFTSFPSTLTGASIASSSWGWLYITTVLGLRAIRLPGPEANNVGPGEIKTYSGPSGQSRQVVFFKDSLFYAELDGTTTRIWRGRFGPKTGSTGQPEWFEFRTLTSTTVNALGVNGDRTLPTLLVGEGEDTLSYYGLSTRVREIDDTNYAFDTGGGTFFGTTLRFEPNLRRMVREAKFVTENCDANNTWRLAVSIDNGSYINVGSAVTSNGQQTVRPVSAGAPLATVDFHALKPRLTQVAASSSAPPQIRGELSIIYDERPETVQMVSLVVLVGARGRTRTTDIDALLALDDFSTSDTITVILPDTPTTTRYAHVEDVQIIDLKGDGVQGVALTLAIWETS